MTQGEARRADLEWLYGRQASPAAPAPAVAEPGPPAVPPPPPPAAPPPLPAAVRDPNPAPRIRPHPAGVPASAPTPPARRTPSGGAALRRAVRRHPFRWAGLVIGLLLVAWIAWLVLVPLIVWAKVTTVNDQAPAVAGVRDAPGTLFLLVGSDSRDDLTQAERDQLGGPAGAGRTDTMLLLYSPPSGRPVLISLPRDSYLPIPGHGKNKLNAAYAFGGAPLLIQTVEQATKLRVNGYLEVNMGGFANLVQAVGGVEVCLDKAVKDKDSQLDLPAGCQTLTGAQALAYARMRHADPLGDLGRIQRQRELIGKIGDKVVRPSTVINPVRYWRLGSAFGATLARGSDTGVRGALTAGLAVAKIGTGRGLSLTVPVSNPNASTPAGSSVLWNDAKAAELFDAIAKGDTSQLDRFAS